jgi:holo-[acyl-carrier protein] synthase
VTADGSPAAPTYALPGEPNNPLHLEGTPAIEAVVRLLTVIAGTPAPPLLRVGVDACDVPVLRRQLTAPTAKHFLATRFTPAELAYCSGRVDRLAARWAAKEAVAKAIGSGFRGLRPAQIEIARRSDGAPYVRAAEGRPWPDNADRWHWSVSLAHEGKIAIAVAIAVVDEPSNTVAAQRFDTTRKEERQ